MSASDGSMRLNKRVAQTGVASRREADRMIQEGKVRVNGEVETNPARAVVNSDAIDFVFNVDAFKSERRYIALNKPIGYVVSTQTKEGPTVYELVKDAGAVFPIGRLDKDSRGLLLFTNDSALPRTVIGEESHVEKEYYVKVAGEISDAALTEFRNGIRILGIITKPAKTRRISKNEFFITLVEGKNRQIRRMCRAVHTPVVELARVRFHTIRLGDLKPGAWRALTQAEVASLRALSGTPLTE